MMGLDQGGGREGRGEQRADFEYFQVLMLKGWMERGSRPLSISLITGSLSPLPGAQVLCWSGQERSRTEGAGLGGAGQQVLHPPPPPTAPPPPPPLLATVTGKEEEVVASSTGRQAGGRVAEAARVRGPAREGSSHGAVATVYPLADPVPGAAAQPPRDLGWGSGVRAGAGPSGWGPSLPAA